MISLVLKTETEYREKVTFISRNMFSRVDVNHLKAYPLAFRCWCYWIVSQLKKITNLGKKLSISSIGVNRTVSKLSEK